MTDVLTVAECFGPTVQGEGPSTGRAAGFVRLGRCLLSCSWCDEPQTWDWQHHDPAVELSERTVEEIVAELDAMGVAMVVVTGGEPLLQQRPLGMLLRELSARGWWVEIETSGTIAPELPLGLVGRFNVSPKLSNSGNSSARRYRPEVLRAFEATGKAAFKFVVCAVTDLDEVDAIVGECGLSEVWIMPEGTDAEVIAARARALAPAVLERRWNLTTRMHILLWGDRRGV